MRRLPALALAALCLPLAAAVPASAGSGDGDHASVVPFALVVNGEVATGLLGVPSGGVAWGGALAVFCHGYGQSASTWYDHLLATAQRGDFAVAMDYGGLFDVARGAAWTLAAAQQLRQAPGVQRAVLFGVSMGGEVCGMAAAQANASGARPFDGFLEAEPLTMLAETWAEAVAVGDPARGQIEQECGGTPVAAPQAYVARSPLLLAPGIAPEVAQAVVVQAAYDGRVPYDQGRSFSLALRGLGVPTDMYTLLRGNPGDLGTTPSSDFGLPNPLDLQGHGFEGSSTNLVMATSLRVLDAMLDGAYHAGDGEFLVDAQLSTLPPP
jgi:pimeloyl-ACP methyl ester carboxylesterase